MEQFNKWWAKECANGRTVYPESYDDCSAVWIAALKWTCSNEFDIDAILYELRKG